MGRRRGRGAGASQRRGGWRATVDSFGGFLTIGVLGGVALIVALLVWNNPVGLGISSDALMGEEVSLGPASHTSDPGAVQTVAGDPPAGGPHFASEAHTGVYEQALEDGDVVHSLEHGIVWLSYNAELASEGDIEVLREVAGRFGNDVIMSPRPRNSMPVALVSWGRILRLQSVDAKTVEDFIRTNLNRSPEPGVR